MDASYSIFSNRHSLLVWKQPQALSNAIFASGLAWIFWSELLTWQKMINFDMALRLASCGRTSKPIICKFLCLTCVTGSDKYWFQILWSLMCMHSCISANPRSTILRPFRHEIENFLVYNIINTQLIFLSFAYRFVSEGNTFICTFRQSFAYIAKHMFQANQWSCVLIHVLLSWFTYISLIYTFNSQVLKTKDYIQVEQEKPLDYIKIKPRAKLLKSDFWLPQITKFIYDLLILWCRRLAEP